MNNLAERWVEIISTGLHLDSEGKLRNIDADFLEAVVAGYDKAIHEAPAVIGHPANNAPAYGWAKALRVRDGVLEAQFGEVDSNFEQMVRDGRFKKRSASFYLDPATAPGGRAPYLRHVGFLGAQPPAIKGLRDIQFSEGDALTFEIQSIQFSEDETMDTKEKEIADSIFDKLKALFSSKKDEGAPVSFTEADLNAKIETAIKSGTASFIEKITALETQNKELTAALATQSNKTTRTELAAFVESLGVAKLPPALKPGLVEFMETLADGGDRKVTLVEFSEDANKNKVEKKTEFSQLGYFKNLLANLGPFIEFGERFGGLKPAGGDLGAVVDQGEVAALRAKSDVPVKEAANAK
jgi:hypothetical protein